MARIQQIAPENATGRSQELLKEVKHRMGMVPNMTRAMVNAPVTLEAYLQFHETLGKGALSAKVREQIALAISEKNQCEYCVAAHSAVGRMVGLTVEQIHDGREGTAVDPGTNALLHFALRVLETRGGVTDADVAEVKNAGFDDAAISEVVANVAIHVFTNYFNRTADTDNDFPKVAPLKAKAASNS